MQLMLETGTPRRMARAAMTMMLTAMLTLAFVPAAMSNDATVKADAELKLEAAEGMPRPDELYARYIKAMGGEEAIRKNTSMSASGRWSMAAMGMEGTFRILAAEPSRFIMELSAPGIGTMRTAFTGEIGWTSGELTGTSLMEEREMADMRIDADFYYPLTYRDHFTWLKTAEKIEFAGTPCYHVKGTRKTGDDMSMYFDAETGLLKGGRGVRTSEHGAMLIVTIYHDYEEVGGVQMPRRMTMNLPDLGIEQQFHMDRITHNEVAPSVFEPPAAIKRLLERREREAAESDKGNESSGD